MSSVHTEVKNGVGWIKLNRPKILNSLNLEMVHAIYQKLVQWKKYDQVAIICFTGEGEKGFCAGGDMRTFHDLKDNGGIEYAKQFFKAEYKMDLEIHYYPKPVVTFMHGINMGGGVGISIGSSHRLVTEKTKWAMPEMNIGFFPDVGASYFLNQMPGATGMYLALTSEVIDYKDILFISAADYFITTEQWNNCVNKIKNTKWSLNSAQEQMDEILQEYNYTKKEKSNLEKNLVNINKHFSHDSVEYIINSLSEDESEWAGRTKSILLSKSPTSLKVTHRQLQKGRTLTLDACFEMEYALSMNFIQSNDDFYEGVRAVLVDKDRNPRWNPNSFNEVPLKYVESFFEYDN